MSTAPDRVRDLIRSSGLSQHAFALQIGLDDSKLSKSLSGARRFGSLDLARIAELCGVTVDWIITGAEPELALAARSAGGSAKKAFREAKRLSIFRSDVHFLGYPQPWAPLGAGSLGGRLIDQGAKLADAALKRVRKQGRVEPLDDLAAVIEATFGIDVAITDLGNDFDGLAVSADEVKLIVAATSAVPARQRFTLAHELGHLLAGDDQGLHVDEDIYDASRKKDPSEMRANAFAAAFLMAEPVLRAAAGTGGLTEKSFAALVCSLGVSPSALAYRLQSFRLIDAGTCERFRALSGARAAQLAGHEDEFARQVAAASASRPPGLLVRDTYLAYDSGAATLRPYAALIGADIDSLRSSFESPAGVDDLP